MNLYAAHNGYTGYGPVMALIIAEDEIQALDLARDSFRRDEMSRRNPRADYWENVQVLFIASCDEPVATRPSDEGIEMWTDREDGLKVV